MEHLTRRVPASVVLAVAFSLAAAPMGDAATKTVKKTPKTSAKTTKPAKKIAAKATTTTAVAPTTAAPTTTTVALPVVAFTACATGVECATVNVPVDHKNPGAEEIGLFVSRRRATDPGARIGALFVNPGGPGSPVFDTVRGAARFLTSEVLARFDVVGVDPRGTERSSALSCGVRGVDSTSTDRVELSRALYDAFAQSCGSREGARLSFMDTETAARDIDAVRAALREEKISFLGFSYGTYLGAVYGALFPDRARSLVLDSAIDPARFGLSQLLDRYVGYERALDGFLDACANGTLPRCQFNDGTDLRAKYLKVREDFANTWRRGRAAGEETFDGLVADLIGYPRNGWPILGRALEELATGVPANFNATRDDNLSTDDRERIVPSDSFSTATNLAINCRDGIVPRDPSAYQQVFDQVPIVAPRFSGLRSEVAAYTCVNWPVPTASLVPLGAKAVTTLVVGNVYDPTTPFLWSQSLAATLGAPLLIRNGGGHGAADKSACVRDAVARFLIDATAPTPGVVCSPDLANPT